MSARIASRRLGQSALAALHPRTCWPSPAHLPTSARRNVSSKNQKITDNMRNPLLEEYLRQKEREAGIQGRLPGAASNKAPPPMPRYGDSSYSPQSLFLPEFEIPGWRDGLSPQQKDDLMARHMQRQEEVRQNEEKALMNMTLDPDQKARQRLERKLVIASVKRHGRMTKAQKLARTERESLYKSHFLPTSTKKLQKVVNQIAGKTISEALVQLRFSKKKVARDVIKGLEIAQNEAIAARGLGLAGESMAVARWEKQRNATDAGKPKDMWDYKTSEKKREVEKKESKAQFHKDTLIELKDGSKKVVRDPSEIYIDQAWVGPGESWKSPEFRARGAINMLKHRTTSFSVLLKEEKTRMRISDEIKKKRDNRKLWVALPDRPVTSQRQYCLW
ncbi:RplV [Pyrenophora teres f. teres]|uniref:RplV n=1 Tax=Pyrenophora teres f. teres TaxID=97479 RepID=A0A6S6VVU0_9PLEO|nr:RplV [Pyrenophora teres f. teres]